MLTDAADRPMVYGYIASKNDCRMDRLAESNNPVTIPGWVRDPLPLLVTAQ
jgi:hypothetical protein